MPSQRNQSDSFRFKRAAFYQSLKSKVGLAATKAAVLRINLNQPIGDLIPTIRGSEDVLAAHPGRGCSICSSSSSSRGEGRRRWKTRCGL
jgi:hypothetical protein